MFEKRKLRKLVKSINRVDFYNYKAFTAKDLRMLLTGSYSDFKYGYNYARKVSQAR